MTNEERSAAARLLAAARKPVKHICPVCDEVFTAVNPRAVYCSPRCLMKKRRADAKAQRSTEVTEWGGS